MSDPGLLHKPLAASEMSSAPRLLLRGPVHYASPEAGLRFPDLDVATSDGRSVRVPRTLFAHSSSYAGVLADPEVKAVNLC